MDFQEIINPSLEKFNKLIEGYIEERKLPHIVALVYSNDKPIYAKKCGFADIETSKPIEFNHIFRIASMTKPIVTFGALMLMEEGKFNFDDPLSKFIPKAADLRVFVDEKDGELITKPLQREITILDLFIHTIGICYPRDLNHPIEKRFNQFNRNYEHKWLSQYVEEILDIPLKVQPGTEWDYGLSIDILALVMEIVSGKHLEEFLQERIFDVLGMVDTHFVVPKEKIDRLVKLTIKANGGLQNSPKEREEWIIRPKNHKGGGGGLASTLSDYLKFSICLINGGKFGEKQLLKSETIDLMMKEYVVSRNIPFEGLRGGPKTKEITRRYMNEYSSGYGQALGAQVKIDDGVVPSGIYGWAGAFTTDFWVDRKNKIIGIVLSQLFPNFRTPIFTEFKEMVYQGLQ